MCQNTILLSRAQLREQIAKLEATNFLINLSSFLVMAIVTVIAFKFTASANENSTKLVQNQQELAVVSRDGSVLNVKSLANVMAGVSKPKVPEIALLRDGQQLGLVVSRGATSLPPRREPTPKPKAPPTPPALPPTQNPNAAAWVDRLNGFLAGSPMAGMGSSFYNAAVSRGLDPRLSASIAKIESNLGRAIPGGYNAFGMTAGTAPGHGRNGRWQAFSSWQDAIESNAAFIKSHWGSVSSPYSMKGYCVGGAWAGNVSGVMASIGKP